MYAMISDIDRRSGWTKQFGTSPNQPTVVDTAVAGQVHFGVSNRFNVSDYFRSGFITFFSSANFGVTLSISDCHDDGTGKIDYLLVSGEWAPENTSSYVIYQTEAGTLNGISFKWTQSEKLYDVSKYVVNASFESNIDGGFTTATVQFAETTSDTLRVFSRSAGFLIRLFLDNGQKAWEGIITQTELNGYSASVSAVGFAFTNEWFLANGVWQQGDQESEATYRTRATSFAIIADSLTQNPYFDPDQFGRLDPQKAAGTTGGQWNAQVAGDYSFGGWGPIDFDETPTTVKDAISSITRYGDHPNIANGLSPDDMYFQVFFDQIPRLTRVPRDLYSYVPPSPGNPAYTVAANASWYIDDSNFEFGYQGLNVETTFSDIKNMRKATYIEVDGETVNSQFAARFPQIFWQGPTQEGVSSGNLTAGEVRLVLLNPMREKAVVSRPGAIRITGLAKRGHGAFKQPVALIKAGDIVFLQIKNTDVFPRTNEVAIGSKFVVGSTRYNSETDTMELSVYSRADLIERSISILDAPEI